MNYLTFHEGYTPTATPGDAHREWHLNAGVPMGQPGCPQDACHPVEEDYVDDYVVDPLWPGAVKCGNRKAHGKEVAYHLGVEGVRACYASFVSAPASAPEPVASEPSGPTFAQRAASWRQIPVGAAGYGYYALPGTDGQANFYRVERPKKGKYAGRTFVKVQAGDTFHPFDREAAYTVMDQIAFNPERSGVFYAQQIGKCSRCGRTLTDDTSRAQGMGPDCARKGGW